jgi:2-methylcitrate dehydratase PrpD
MSSARVKEFLDEVDMFIAWHVIYISMLEKAIEKGEEFDHKSCNECKFSVEWDNHVASLNNKLDDKLKSLAEKIEKIHCEFHEISMQIDTKNPQPSDRENLDRIKKLSTLLLQSLLAFKKLLNLK